jgi:NAD(P)-dependent dehydrogenase (short-subunit alcohol dehydrogenase family)
MSGRVQFDFGGCRVLVTGGTSGIGAGIAAAFVTAGADVTITGTREKASEYDADLSSYTYRQLRMTDNEQIEAVAASLESLDVLVNNAGASLPGGKNELIPDVFEEAVRINLFGAYRLANACRKKLQQSKLEGGASVINMGSMSSYFGIPIVPAYGAAKAAIVQLTKTLAVSWAAKHIRVNAVAPGLIRSNMTAPLEQIEGAATAHLERTPMRRWGEPEDIAGVVLFLASPAARFVTGQTLPVDGGYSIA